MAAAIWHHLRALVAVVTAAVATLTGFSVFGLVWLTVMTSGLGGLFGSTLIRLVCQSDRLLRRVRLEQWEQMINDRLDWKVD